MNITLYYVNHLKDFCIKFITKMYEKKHKITMLCEDEAFLHEVDDALWTSKQISFIPHVIYEHDVTEVPVFVENTPIVLTKPPFKIINHSDMVIILNHKSDPHCEHVVKAFDNRALYEEEKKRLNTATCWIYQNDTWEKDTSS